ncbi:putative Response regulator containing a CheY-like receiver domain and an HTH DNA-binding domain [Vibrio nigripulchritudo MADA3029]|uniref:Putative Response regulator containing a CheY-like receiver domain and an HTH DNA-binding domain n=1 Tax=Vibrio nigripulchritudo TaxID=28173 RepID=U4KIY1_9VIBR|nr:response regulator transcription factor [Vibrio nigripulchritudo]EGU50719.1 two-component system response regulator [Vibrio nigripulchritudo ATCC 27043]KJY78785.1 hypothetical protein TW74_12170 [Vibrio nigripulchritudo]CCN33254.1 putative Response regulator containing a CheY-like receiver domain and an HTH DNA-binding domain [Vibrio nigripulchritudo AM115]CCN42296.1 putative Response regulator containing a CheY-like receiver domain and an HTH DNA-binding domain [Vibrio nigripulchritudo FTn2
MKILVVDDHSIVRQSIYYLLRDRGYTLLNAINGREAVNILQSEEIGLVILDIGIPELNGFEVMKRYPPSPSTKFLVFSAVENESLVNLTANFDVSGFISKSDELHKFVEAVDTILLGGKYFPKELEVNNTNSDASKVSSLSQRELMVLTSIAKGMKNREISSELYLSEKTVSTYKTRLMKKLEVGNAAELFAFCERNRSRLPPF